MPCAIVDPRTVPRVRIDLHADVSHDGEVWEAITRDLGPAGCLLLTPRPLLTGGSLWLLLRTVRLRDSLLAEGHIAWSRRGQGGVVFRPVHGAHAAEWFRRIVAGAPALRSEVAQQMPRRLQLEDRLFLGPSAGSSASGLAGDGVRIMCGFGDGCSVGTLAARVGLPRERFSRAVFALIHTGFLTTRAAETTRLDRDVGRAA